MAKTFRLSNLSIDDVSSVDRGAGEGVRVVLMKRDDTNKSATENDMTTPAELEKQVNELVTKALAPVTAELAKRDADIAKRDEEIAFLKMSPEFQEFCKAMSPEDKKKFMDKKDDEKAKDVAKAKDAAIVKIDPEIKKRLDQADEDRVVLKALQADKDVATFAKRAKEIGLPEADGEIMRKAYGGDAEAQKEFDKRVKALTAQVNVGKVFDEFGSGGPGKDGKTAYEEIVEKAVELRKTESGRKLTEAQARAAVMEDPANAELMKRHKGEEVRKRAA